MAGREKGKRKAERDSPAPSLPSFLPFYFRVRAFSIHQARLSRSPDETGYEKRGRGGHSLSCFLPLIYIILLSSSPRVALRKKDDRPQSNLSYCRKIVTQTCWVSSMTAFAWSLAGWKNEAWTDVSHFFVSWLKERNLHMRNACFAS